MAWTVLAPLTIALPLLAAATLTAISTLTSRRVVDIASIAIAATVTVLCALLLVRSAGTTLVYAFGGWRPAHGIVLGVLFVIDPLGAGLASLVAALVTAALVFSWRYFDAVRSLFHALMLVFLAAMVGFCLTGDLFNLFVFFELMSVAAFALTGYKVEERAPLAGALNFAITNSIGAFLVLIGIGLLYGRTGALNLAQIGRALAGHHADSLVIIAFVLITSGFFTKAAIVPFHFWLADAHAVAPTPVCVLFSGVMDELALYAVARVYWTVFAGSLGPGGHTAALRAVLVVAGTLTALLGAVMCPLQHHVKRLLAFSTLSHMGMFLIGVALLTPLGLAGSAVFIFSHALVKGALFLCIGILLHRFQSVDENVLRGRGGHLRYTGALFVLGGFGIASLPPFGTFLGKGLIEEAASAVGYSWATPVLIVASIFTGGAVLRVAGSVFLGWGQTVEDPSARSEGEEREPESKGAPSRTPLVMFAPALLLIVGSLFSGVLPRLSQATEIAAAHFQDQQAYLAVVLGSAFARVPSSAPSLDLVGPTLSMGLSGLISAAGAVIYALLALFGSCGLALLRKIGAIGMRLFGQPLAWLQTLQSGHVGDYVTWLSIGVVLLGVACVVALR